MSSFRPFARLSAGFLALTLIAGCGGSGSGSGNNAPPAISVAISPTSATLAAGATQTFAASVTNDTANAGVTWTASTGTITATGVYTAPAVITTTSATVTATSKTDTTKTASATITLTPISVSLLPTTTTLAAGATQTFTPTVTGDTTLNQGVTWTATTGTITSGGVYTAPAVITTASATVTATSKTDTTKTATATVTLTPIAVSVSPTTATLIGGATQTFTATVTGDGTLNQGVTWTASTGTITGAGVYTAPAVITTTSATITATSKTDTTKSATAAVTLTPISLGAISPATISLGSSGSQAFTDAVANDSSNSGVTWSIGAGVGTLTASSSTGVTYNAPTTAIASVTTVTLTATSIKDPTKSTTATITLNPVAISLTPTSVAPMIGAATQPFTATVANDSSNSGVTWTVTGGGSFSAGATASGVATTYTAASPVSAATAVVTATSVKDPSKSASATITLTPIAMTFSTPTTGITLDTGQTMALTAAVANDSSASGATFTTAGAGTVNPPSATGNSPATTLTASGTVVSTVTVTATSTKDPSRSAITSSITVNPTLTFTTIAGGLPAGTLGTPYPSTSILSSTGGTGTKTFAIATGSLPAGLSLSGSTGAITGTPTGSTGISTFTFKVTDSATTPVTLTSGTFTITIGAVPLVWVSPTTSTLTYTVGTAITPITLSATGGTGAVTYTVNAGLLPAGLAIVGNQIIGTPTAPTVVTGNVVGFLATDSTSPTPQTAVSATSTFIVNPVALSITSAALPTGTVGAPYSYQLVSSGGTAPIVWSLTSGSLAGTGLSLSGSGIISGTPTATQSGLPLTFQAKDSAVNQQQTITKSLPLNVGNALIFTTTSSLPNATSNAAYTQTLAAAGGSGSGYTFTVTSGATGSNSLASLNLVMSSAGVVSGTPAAAGTANFTVQVKDSSNNTATASFTIAAFAPLVLPTPNPGSLPSATINASYNGVINATGGSPGYTWTVNGSPVPTNGSTSSLSNGLSVSNSGGSSGLSVTGTPTAVGTVSFTASVQDSAGTTVGPLTYTVSVSSGYTVSGQISPTNSCNNSGLDGITVSINTTPVQTTTTAGGGLFSFSGLVNGTYILTPSIAGPSAVFYPATQSVVVTNGSITAASINAALGYTVSGTVAYAGAQTGQVYLALNNTTCSGNGSLGTSISAAGAFTIRGVPPGTYTLQAFMDIHGNGVPNADNPAGSTSGVTVATANLPGVSLTLNDPASVTLATAPTLQAVSGFDKGAVIQYKPIVNGSGVEMATYYTLQWNTTSTFTGTGGSKQFRAYGTHYDVWFLNSGLVNGNAYYFRAYGTSAGTAIGPTSTAIGPITIGAPTAGNTVTGSVTFSGAATGPLYVGFLDQNTNAFYGQYFATPVSAQAYSILVPTGSNYFFIGVVDQNQDGEITTGDLSNTGNDKTVTVISGPTNLNLTLPSGDGSAIVTTQVYQQSGSGGTSQSYNLSFQVSGLVKQPVAVTATSSTNASGANVATPIDIALCTVNNCKQGFQVNFSTGSVAPVVGDTYTFSVTYSDSSTGTLTATVTGVLNAFATSLAPTGVGGGATPGGSTTPTLSWLDPSNASNYTYQFNLNDSTGNTVWQVPGINSNSSSLTSATTSLIWGVDPTDSTNLPSPSTLSTSTIYNWQITVQDSVGNSAVTQVQYQP